MSEEIIKALLKLFAVFARPDSDTSDKQDVIELFLTAQLNKELARNYLPSFNSEYQEVISDINRIKEKGKSKSGDVLKYKIEAKLAARIHRICNSINQELTHKQKLFVVISILEFISSSTQDGISQTEKEFLEILVDDLNINQEEYIQLSDFILNSFEEIPESPYLLIIDNNKKYDGSVKHILSKQLTGKIKVFYLSSSNLLIFRSLGVGEITLNSQPVHENKVSFINIGSAIRSKQIKPIYYSQILNIFNVDNSQEGVVFEAKEISYQFKGGNIGLHNLTLQEESGNLVGIMGASGAGKSTLLNVLNGSYAPTSGSVTINGTDLHNDEEGKLDGLIGFVPQDDLLIKELTVWQNLYYNAKLCFDNLEEEEILEKVDKVLQALGLFERKNNIVGDELKKEISGGQRKRLNIALELIREPAILFLDEPTSGLSSKDSENIMDLLKELALKGKLVFVVIHQPSSDIFKTFDKLLILDTGGYQIYYGAPVDSIMYFKQQMSQADWYVSECETCGNVNPEQIFNITEAKILNEDGTPLLNNKRQEIRKYAPTDWYDMYHTNNPKDKEGRNKKIPKELPEITFKIPNWIRQFKVFVVRDVLSKISNMQYMLINSLESPIIAVFLAFIIKYWDVDEKNDIGYTLMNNSNIPVYIFMLVICGFFIGLTVSAEEIYRDQKIRTRESFLNLSWSSYLISKISILFVISAIQSFVFILIGNAFLGIEGMLFHYWLMAFSIWCFANLVGLIISDAFNDVKTIYILIPFMVIPQIILSGIIVSFDKLNPTISNPQNIPWYGEAIASRWAYEGLATYQYSKNDFEKNFFAFNKEISVCSYKKGEWSNQLNNRVNDCERNLPKPELKEEVEKDLLVLFNEISKEQTKDHKLQFPRLNELSYDKVNTQVLEEARSYLKRVKKYYIDRNIDYRDRKNQAIYSIIDSLGNVGLDEMGVPKEERTKKQIDSVGNYLFIDLKKRHYNESLEEFCKNENDFTVLIEYKGNLIQKVDPIFLEPESTVLSAHFYAPVKPFFGLMIETYWANVIVIWLMTIISYVFLYFRLFRKLIEVMSNIKFKK